MDALSAQLSRLRLLLFGSPIGSALMLLAPGGAVWLAWAGDPDLRVEHEVTLLLAAGALLGRAAHRVNALVISAALIGIPDHARRVRRAQWTILALYAALAFICALPFGLDPRSMTVSLGICGGVLAFVAFPVVGVLGVVVVMVVDEPARNLERVLQDPLTGIITAIGTLAMVIHWFGAAERGEKQSRQATTGLADDQHEDANAAEYQAAEVAFSSYLGDVMASKAHDPITARRLWIGMGHDPSGSRKSRLMASIAAILALLAAHLVFQGRWDRAVFFVISAIVGMTIFGRFSAKSEAWLRSPGEQSLLTLAPAFPAGARLKLLIVRSLWPGIPADLAFWAAFSAMALYAGWVQPRDVSIAGAALASVVVTCLGLMMSYLSHSHMRKRMWWPMFHLLSAIVGCAVILIAGFAGHLPSGIVGATLLFAPFLLALLSFTLRRLQFPVQPHGQRMDWT